jgi:hypothetical protein
VTGDKPIDPKVRVRVRMTIPLSAEVEVEIDRDKQEQKVVRIRVLGCEDLAGIHDLLVEQAEKWLVHAR